MSYWYIHIIKFKPIIDSRPDRIKHFIFFEAEDEKVAKKMAAYHQYHAVNKAVECTVKACSPQGDQRAGM
jgi:type I restriction enzyme R subunit